jgi:transcriptional regulator with XRE-family HTH domain
MPWTDANMTVADRSTPVSPPTLVPYDREAAKRVGLLMTKLGMTGALAEELKVSRPGLSDWLGGRNTGKPSVQAAAAAAVQWWQANKDASPPLPPPTLVPYDREAAKRVQSLMNHLDKTTTVLAVELNVKRPGLSKWLAGQNTGTPSVQAVGAAAVQWWQANKEKSPPPPPPTPMPHDPEAAKCVGLLMNHLGKITTVLALELEVGLTGLYDWLGGRNTGKPSVQAAGAAAVLWWQANEEKSPPPPPSTMMPRHDPHHSVGGNGDDGNGGDGEGSEGREGGGGGGGNNRSPSTVSGNKRQCAQVNKRGGDRGLEHGNGETNGYSGGSSDVSAESGQGSAQPKKLKTSGNPSSPSSSSSSHATVGRGGASSSQSSALAHLSSSPSSSSSSSSSSSMTRHSASAVGGGKRRREAQRVTAVRAVSGVRGVYRFCSRTAR